jgi:hypothetical protein
VWILIVSFFKYSCQFVFVYHCISAQQPTKHVTHFIVVLNTYLTEKHNTIIDRPIIATNTIFFYTFYITSSPEFQFQTITAAMTLLSKFNTCHTCH